MPDAPTTLCDDNRPLARASLWVFCEACLVIVVLAAVLARSELADLFFARRRLFHVGTIALLVLFALSCAVAMTLGFLSGCRPGRRIGYASLGLLALGLTLGIGLYVRVVQGF